MKLFKIKVVLIIFLLSIISCSPAYKTSQTYVTPQTDFGKLCALECSAHKTQCRQQCNFALFLDPCNSVCKSDYDICFTNCGGEIKNNKVCIAFCDK